MKRLIKVLEIVHKKVTKEDWDNLLILTGDEGIGKSNLALHIADWWITKQYGEVKPEHIKFVSLDRKQFLKNLKECNRFDIPIYDESGDLSNKRSMSGYNLAITKAYQIIRGDNLFTILVLPSVFDLEGFFTKRRARGLIHVYRRGRFAYWDKGRLRRTIAYNQMRRYKNIWTVLPLFYDTFPKYKGTLSKEYLTKKAAKIKDVRTNLYAEVVEGEGIKVKQRNILITELSKLQGVKYVANLLGVSESLIYKINKKVKADS